MKPFKKMQKRLEARQRGCVEMRKLANQRSAKVSDAAYRMPGSFKRK
jgi:hypothetical protein